MPAPASRIRAVVLGGASVVGSVGAAPSSRPVSSSAVDGVRSVESRTTRSGDAPGTIRTLRRQSSRSTVPTPTMTASQAARRACDSARSSSPLIHFESPSPVAIRPSRVWAYFRTT